MFVNIVLAVALVGHQGRRRGQRKKDENVVGNKLTKENIFGIMIKHLMRQAPLRNRRAETAEKKF